MEYKPFIEYLENNNISKDDALNLLKQCNDLSQEDKNLIYLYCFPRPLGDRELPSRMMGYRRSKGYSLAGSLVPHLGETSLLVEAERTEQYKKFMHHIILAFTDPSKVNPVSGKEIDECPICGKQLYEFDIWNEMLSKNPGSPEAQNKEYLSFGSKESSVCMCLDCLIQLVNAANILEEIDPTYLNWREKKSKENPWNDIKM